MESLALRWPDLAVIAISFALLIGIGVICSRRSNSAEGYFLAGRSMPGWVLAFSMMATIVSSMTFLALPALTYEFNWWHFPANSSYLIAMFVALILFVPFYRRAKISSAYEYLERRFGTWARLYAAACFVLFHVFRMGIILYVVSLSVQAMVGGFLTLLLSIASGGLLGLFMLGFLTRRVGSGAACLATVTTFASVTAWLLLDSPLGRELVPAIADWLPDKFWVGPYSNFLLFGLGYAVSLLVRQNTEKDLTGLTIWTAKAPKSG